MANHKIKTATACYTGGGIYIYYGQLESGLYFRTDDESETIYICNANTSTDEAEYAEFYEQHTEEELTGADFKAFWNAMLRHIIHDGPACDDYSNFSAYDLAHRIIK